MTTAVLDRTWHGASPQTFLAGPNRRRHLGWITAVAFILVAALIVAGVFALHHSDDTKTAPPTTPLTSPVRSPGITSSSPPPSSTSTTQGAPAAVVTAVLPMVSCPTTYAASPASTVVLPSTASESVPKELVTQLAVYTDEGGFLRLLGPTGWNCSASYGADGSGGVSIYPAGNSGPTSSPFEASSDEAIRGTETSACFGCTVGQACPLFPAAAAENQSSGFGSCQTRPPQESVEPIESGVVGFEDPPYVAGDGNPSGGPYSANGVMTYQNTNYDGSFVDTCTLPTADVPICTAALNNFVQSYGSE